MPKKNKNIISSLSFLEGKLRAAKESQKRIQLLIDAWKAEIYYKKLFDMADANPASSVYFQTEGALQKFVALKRIVDNEYGLQHVFGKYKAEYNQRCDADHALKKAKASLETITETSAPETKHGSVFLKNVMDELEEAAYKEQIDNKKIAALVINVDSLHKAVFGKKGDLSPVDGNKCLEELAQYIEEKIAEDAAREQAKREKKSNTIINKLRRSFKKSKLPKEAKAEKAGSEKNATGFGKLRHSFKKKSNSPSDSAPSEADQFPFGVQSQEQGAEASALNQKGQKQNVREQESTVSNSGSSTVIAASVAETSLNAWGDAGSYQAPKRPTVESVLALYKKAVSEQRHAAQKNFEDQYNAAFDELSQSEQVEFCSRLDALRVQDFASADRPIQPKPSTSSGLSNALQAIQSLFKQTYAETDPERQDTLQEQYILAYNELDGDKQDEFEKWAADFTAKLQRSTDFNRLGESNAWGTHHSTFFTSAPAAARSEYHSNAVYEQSEAMKARK